MIQRFPLSDRRSLGARGNVLVMIVGRVIAVVMGVVVMGMGMGMPAPEGVAQARKPHPQTASPDPAQNQSPK